MVACLLTVCIYISCLVPGSYALQALVARVCMSHVDGTTTTTYKFNLPQKSINLLPPCEDTLLLLGKVDGHGGVVYCSNAACGGVNVLGVRNMKFPRHPDHVTKRDSISEICCAVSLSLPLAQMECERHLFTHSVPCRSCLRRLFLPNRPAAAELGWRESIVFTNPTGYLISLPWTMIANTWKSNFSGEMCGAWLTL